MASLNTISTCKYDVFTSFKGEDVPETLLSHLYATLCEKGVKTFNDALFEAIEGSKISVIVFSENYATSELCLDELVHILKCKENKGQIVLPLFYYVDPSHVRNQEESYANAFDGHERRFGPDSEKVVRWRFALKQAGKMAGWDSRNYRYESDLVADVVKDILKKLSIKEGGVEDDFNEEVNRSNYADDFGCNSRVGIDDFGRSSEDVPDSDARGNKVIKGIDA